MAFLEEKGGTKAGYLGFQQREALMRETTGKYNQSHLQTLAAKSFNRWLGDEAYGVECMGL